MRKKKSSRGRINCRRMPILGARVIFMGRGVLSLDTFSLLNRTSILWIPYSVFQSLQVSIINRDNTGETHWLTGFNHTRTREEQLDDNSGERRGTGEKSYLRVFKRPICT